MGMVNSFEELIVWQRARELSGEIYWRSKQGSFKTDFELQGQINRASGSVMDNIAEGFEKNGNTEFALALTIAKGSSGEVRSQLFRALDRKHLTQAEFEEFNNKANSITKMIGSLRNHLKKSGLRGSRYKNS